MGGIIYTLHVGAELDRAIAPRSSRVADYSHDGDARVQDFALGLARQRLQHGLDEATCVLCLWLLVGHTQWWW